MNEYEYIKKHLKNDIKRFNLKTYEEALECCEEFFCHDMDHVENEIRSILEELPK